VTDLNSQQLKRLAEDIKRLGPDFGFDKLGIAGIDLDADEAYLDRWLALERHGEMAYMQRHGRKRTRPEQLIPGTVRVICARMNYWPLGADDAKTVLDDGRRAYLARYALGRDYHKTLRSRLKKLAQAIENTIGDFAYRVFVDSAPVLEKALARNAGLGWIGKHSNLLDREAGSFFLLGEIYTDLALPVDRPVSAHCGSCRACLDICPTQAIVAPYEVDARRCVSYLTIELKSSIPIEFRTAIGNRVFGCDDCQLVCPWNKYARLSAAPEFAPRHDLDGQELVALFAWTEAEWSSRTEGSAVRRPGYEGWLRNVAVALGNAPTSPAVLTALAARAGHRSPLVREHVQWALQQHR
jgi:epoxyqueuosine reductase